MLMSLERMAFYLDEHPDAVRHIAANCTLFDEELIEFLNAKVSYSLCLSNACFAYPSPLSVLTAPCSCLDRSELEGSVEDEQ